MGRTLQLYQQEAKFTAGTRMLEEKRSIGEIGNNIRYENTWNLVQKDTHYRSTLPWDC
jgi:hypothetical protein